jgi:hypothetical protein
MTMQNNEASVRASLRRGPSNKGKLVGAKPPLRPKHVWSIRTKLQIADRKRDLAMFNLAIDSKLPGCPAASEGALSRAVAAKVPLDGRTHGRASPGRAWGCSCLE